MKTTAVTLILALTSAAFSSIGAAPHEPLSARATIIDLTKGEVGSEGRTAGAIVVTNEQKLAELEAMFPRFAEAPEAEIAGGWLAGYVIFFEIPKSKKIVKVTLSKNHQGQIWTAGRGDFETQGSFQEYVKSLEIGEASKAMRLTEDAVKRFREESGFDRKAMKIEGVTGVGTSRDRSGYFIQIYCKNEKALKRAKKELGKSVKGIPVQYKVSGEFRALKTREQ